MSQLHTSITVKQTRFNTFLKFGKPKFTARTPSLSSKDVSSFFDYATIYCYALIILLFTFWNANLLAQGKERLLQIHQQSTTGHLTFNGNTPMLQILQNNEQESMDLRFKKLHFEGEDLQVIFDLRDFKNYEKDLHFLIRIAMQNNGNVVEALPEHTSGTVFIPFGKSGRNLQITWADFFEFQEIAAGSIQFKITAELWGIPPTNCETPPSFTLQKQKGYWLAGGFGGLALGAGLILKNSSEKQYEMHLAQVFENHPEAADDFYDKANNRDKASYYLIRGGAAVLVTNALLYGYNFLKYKKQQKIHKSYCLENQPIGVQPFWNSEGYSTQVGATLVWKF